MTPLDDFGWRVLGVDPGDPVELRRLACRPGLLPKKTTSAEVALDARLPVCAVPSVCRDMPQQAVAHHVSAVPHLTLPRLSRER
ncbi:MAG: hypothetical protein ACRELA_21000 [Candidatus Rokuibacteriota bacterium]